MPRLRIHSVEFEGPIYDTWPPDTHRRIFIESPDRDNLPVYARRIIQNFMSRAWRRPVTDSEVDMVTDVWAASYAELRDFRRSIQDALVVVLTSPQFLFLTEHSTTPEAEPLNDWELASKLSYFLWNSPPDASLRDAAAAEQLRAEHVRLEHGESTPFDVLLREQDLVQAQSQKILAQNTYHNSITALDRAQGTILERNQIVVDQAAALR